MNASGLDVALWVLASPVLFVRWIVRLVRRCLFYRMAYAPKVACRTCGGGISLVGMWRCSCGHTSVGHVLRVCPVCRSLPRIVRCPACGATEVLPEL